MWVWKLKFKSIDQDNLGFREVVFDVVSPHFEAYNESVLTDEQLKVQKFYDILWQENQELYPGCDFPSPLNTTSRLLNINTTHNVAQTTFDGYFFVMKSVFPRENKLSGSFYNSKKLSKKLGMRVEKIHLRPNECMLFYKETTHL